MNDTKLLQIRGVTEIIAGGYAGEPNGVSQDYAGWTDVDDASDGVQTYFYYCDSNNANNATRSQTNVVMKTSWDAELTPENTYHIKTKTYLISITRVAKPGPDGNAPASSGDTPGNGRDIYIFAPNAACSAGAALRHWFAPYNANGTIFSGNLFIASAEYDLAPGEVSGSKSAAVYRNLTEGFPGYLCVDSMYTDAMVMGFQFRNNMPTVLPPPVHTGTRQEPDICENYMDVYLTFGAPPVNGAELYLEWRYKGETTWSEQNSVRETASRTTPVTVMVHKVAPTNHTASPVVIEWRAKFRPVTVKMEESDWTYGETQIEYIPAPNMTVPDITVEECTSIGKGDLIPPYTEEQCYIEAVCQEQDDIRNILQKREWEKNRECRVINRVATPEDYEILAKGDK